VFTLSLRQADPTGRTLIICSSRDVDLGASRRKTVTIRMLRHISFGHIIDRLMHAGIFRYRLNADGSGGRWWLSVILSEMNLSGLVDPKNIGEAQIMLRVAWNDEGQGIQGGFQSRLSQGTWQSFP